MRIFLALVLAYILSIFYRSFLSVIAGPFSADLGIGPAELANISAAWFVAFALMQFPVGWALDRIGPRRTVSACMAVGAVGAIWFARAGGPGSAMAAMALVGVGCAPIFMSALYLFARSGPAGGFAGLASLFIGLGSLGNLVSAAPLARAADAFGWRPAMLAVAGLFMLAGLVAALLLRDPPPAEGDAGQDGVLAGLKAILSIRALWLIAPITFFAYAILATQRGLWVAPYLAEVNGLSRVEQGNGAFLMAITMTAGAFLFAWAERRMGGPKPTVLWSTLAFAGLLVLLALTGHWSGTWAIALFAAIGLIGFNYAILMAHARAFFPERLIGRGVTTLNFLFIAGTAVVQAASGAFIAAERAAGFSPTAAFTGLNLAFAAILALCVAIYAFAPRRP